jgi:hypothetical protein
MEEMPWNCLDDNHINNQRIAEGKPKSLPPRLKETILDLNQIAEGCVTEYGKEVMWHMLESIHSDISRKESLAQNVLDILEVDDHFTKPEYVYKILNDVVIHRSTSEFDDFWEYCSYSVEPVVDPSDMDCAFLVAQYIVELTHDC